MGWLPLLGGSGANAIPLSGLTVKSNAYVGRPMPRLDEIRKLASAMAAADKSVRYLTAAWAALTRPSGRHLFYSTSGENVSSQRVAARLGLRPIGWLWQLARVRVS